MRNLEAKFAKMGIDNAPGQEINQAAAALPLRGEALPGRKVDFSHGDVDAFLPTPGALEAFVEGFNEGGKQAYTEYSGRSDELLADWLGDEAYMFKTPAEWKSIIGAHDRIASVETWEMSCFDAAWAEWFASGHKFAAGDLKFFENLIKPYTCFAGIHIKLK